MHGASLGGTMLCVTKRLPALGKREKGGALSMLGDLLMEINGQMTSITVEPPTPEGSKVQVQVASEISGRVNGASLETHYVIIRPDGQTGYGEGHGLINTAEG